MKILFSNCCTSQHTFSTLFLKLKNKPETSIQNYFNLLYKGLKNEGCELFTLCERQISCSEEGIYKKGYEDYDDIGSYYYVPKLLIPGLSQLFSLLTNFVIAIKIIKKFKPDVIICDLMRFYVSIPTKWATRIYGITVIGFAADVPQMYNHHASKKKSSFLKLIISLYSSAAKDYDAYLILSEYMNELINPNNKQSLIIEGIADKFHTCSTKKYDTANDPTIIMYSGGLHAKYGVKMLIDSVESIQENVILWLFGKGDQEDYLKSLQCSKIFFFGYQPRELVVEKQKEAHFLISPRFSSEEYTKYSFPSKIMEYMLSGTPVISTRIKSIPKDYFNHIIPIDIETVEGLQETIKKSIMMSSNERKKIGIGAAMFVEKEKNFCVHGERLNQWLNKIVNINGRNKNKN